MRDNRNKLFGGWLRLYIVFVVIWGGFVALIALKDWPAPGISDHMEVMGRLDNKSKEILSKSLVNASSDIDQAIAAEKNIFLNSDISRLLTLKTGATAILPEEIDKDEILRLQVAYAEATDEIQQKKKIETLIFSLFFWVVPSCILLGVGLTCRWVYRGFNK